VRSLNETRHTVTSVWIGEVSELVGARKGDINSDQE
jgi:hypothetical protein